MAHRGKDAAASPPPPPLPRPGVDALPDNVTPIGNAETLEYFESLRRGHGAPR